MNKQNTGGCKMNKIRIISIIAMASFFISFLVNINAQKPPDDPIKVFKDKKCSSCHSIKLVKIERKNKKSKAPDLSNVGAEHEPDFFMDWLLKNTEQSGKKHPIKFNGTDEEFATLLGFLVTLRDPQKEQE
jgi:cytochrome c1